MRRRLEQNRRCGVAAQRWRFTVRAVSGHGPVMHSTRLHGDAAAAAAAAAATAAAATAAAVNAVHSDDQANLIYGYDNNVADKFPTIACAHTMSNSSNGSRSCNVDAHVCFYLDVLVECVTNNPFVMCDV